MIYKPETVVLESSILNIFQFKLMKFSQKFVQVYVFNFQQESCLYELTVKFLRWKSSEIIVLDFL